MKIEARFDALLRCVNFDAFAMLISDGVCLQAFILKSCVQTIRCFIINGACKNINCISSQTEPEPEPSSCWACKIINYYYRDP